MGVMGSFCQLCALPVQHAQYVREPNPGPGMSGLLRIVRGMSVPKGGFALDERHAWLADAVVVAAASQDGGDDEVVRGRIEDGWIEGRDDIEVYSGSECGAVTYHHACWIRLGSPRRIADTRAINGSYTWSTLEVHHGQLFEFRELEIDGRAWMLEDPASSAPSAARLDELIALARGPHERRERFTPGSTQRIGDAGWSGYVVRSGSGGRLAVVRARKYSTDAEREEFPNSVLMVKDFPPSSRIQPAHEALALAFKALVDEDGSSIMTCARFRADHLALHAYARDGDALVDRIDKLPGLDEGDEAKLASRPDAAWADHRTVCGI